jgi:hypothetical protein
MNTNENTNALVTPAELQATAKDAAAALSDQFLRYKGNYVHINHTSTTLKFGDAQLLAKRVIQRNFSQLLKDQKTLDEVLQSVFSGEAEYPWLSVALWDGRTRCQPGSKTRVLRTDLMASINTWIEPSYRGLGEQKADISMLEQFLDRTVVEAEDKTRFLDWLSWCLQNESDKPGWAPLLYSHEKGTGKSTLTKLLEKLFGQENTMQSNGVSQVTGRFNYP